MSECNQAILNPAHCGELESAIAVCNAKLAEADVDHRTWADTMLLVGICKMAMLDNRHCEIAINAALEEYRELRDEEMEAYCRVQLMRPALDVNEAASVKDQLVGVITVAEQRGWDGVLSVACWVLSRVHLEEKKDSLADEAIVRSQSLPDPFRLQWERIVRNVYLVCGRLLRHTEVSQNGLLRILGTLESYRIIPRVNIYYCSEMSRCCYLSGDLLGSADMMLLLLEYLDECPESWGCKWWLKATWQYNLGHNCCARGDFARARSAFREARQTAHAHGYTNLVPILSAGEGVLALKTGNSVEAVEIYRKVIRDAVAAGANLPFYMDHYLAIALLACGRCDEATGHWSRKQTFQVTHETRKIIEDLEELLQRIVDGHYPSGESPEESCRETAWAWLGELGLLRNRRMS